MAGIGTSRIGTTSIGSGTQVSTSPDTELYQHSFTSSGRSTTSAAMTVISHTGNVIVQQSLPTAPDIVMAYREGPDSFSTGAGGQATVTMGMGNITGHVVTINGKATVDYNNVGVAFATTTKPEGKAEITSNRMLVILASDYLVIYTSKPPYKAEDVLLAKSTGPQLPNRLASTVGSFWIGGDMLGGDSQTLEPAPLSGQMYAFTTSRATVTIAATQSYSMSMRANGRAAGSVSGTQAYAIRITSAGVAGCTKNYLSSPMRMESLSSGRTTVRDQFGTTGFWYLGSSIHQQAVSNGRARPRTINNVWDGWYLGSSVRQEAVSNGKATMKSYIGSRVYWEEGSWLSQGRGGARDQFGTAGRWYLGSPHYIAATSRGRAGSPFNYLASRVFPGFSTSLNTGAGGAWYLAGPVSLKATMAGRSSFIFESELGIRYLQSAMRGRGVMSLFVPDINNPNPAFAMKANAGCRAYDGWLSDTNPEFFNKGFDHPGTYQAYWVGYTGPQGVFFYQAGPTSIRNKPMAGRATMVENEEFMPWNFRMHSHAGCNAWPATDPTNGNILRQYNRGGLTSNQEDAVYPDDWIPAELRGKRRPEEDDPVRLYQIRNPHWTNNGRRMGVGIYLSSTLQFQNNDPNRHGVWPYGGPSTMMGRSTMRAEFDPQLDLKANAGCREGGNHYQADRDPAFFRPGGPYYAPYYVPYAGVKMAQTGATYMTWDDRMSWWSTRPTLVHLTMGVTWQRLRPAEMRGISNVNIKDPNTIFFGGVAAFENNYINVPSYNLQRWDTHYVWPRTLPQYSIYSYDQQRRAGGQATMYLYAAGRVEMDKWRSNGKAAFGENYIASPVYLRTQSDGVSNNSADGHSQAQLIKIFAGCYPWYFITKPTNTDPGGDVIWQPGIIFNQDRVNPSLRTAFRGFSSMTAEEASVPILRATVGAKANWVIDAGFTVGKEYYGFKVTAGSYGYETYEQLYPTWLQNGWVNKFDGKRFGVTMTAFQERLIDIDGKATVTSTPGLLYFLEWHKRGDPTHYYLQKEDGSQGALYYSVKPTYGGMATMTLEDDRRFMEARTRVNLAYDHNGRLYYPFYDPYEWHMVVDFALMSRSRGRARFYSDRVFGNLLHRVHKAPQPGIPNIDGGSTQPYGQFWPRRMVLPWPKIPPTTPNHSDYEYYRR